MPANVFVAIRASVTAGLANDVDAVNQYADAIYEPTASGTAVARCRAHDTITASRPKVATTSLKPCGRPARTCVDHANNGSPNIASAQATPTNAPDTCAAMYAASSGIESSP